MIDKIKIGDIVKRADMVGKIIGVVDENENIYEIRRDDGMIEVGQIV